jgi:sugar phosphate isomerase/epimerase
MTGPSRRRFLQQSLISCAAAWTAGTAGRGEADSPQPAALGMRFGLVTYQWGKDWDIPTLIAHCSAASIGGVELRVEHAHRVQPSLDAPQRAEVKKRFADSPVAIAGLGTNEAFHHPEPEKVRKALENAKAFVRLAHDVGTTGVKVKPDGLPKGVPQEKTVAQIGRALGALGKYAADFGQQIRLEVHGGCARVPIIKQIIDIADHPNVGLCWNSNVSDLQDGGLEANFRRVRNRLGATTHVRPLDSKDYPFAQFVALLVKSDYRGWVLLEAGGAAPKDPVAAMIRQRKLFESMVAAARG